MERQREESSLIGAVVDVLDAGQRVLLDRIELLAVEARAGAANALASAALMLCGLGLLLVGWVAVNAVAVVLLLDVWTHAQAIGVVAVGNLAAGATALLLARRRGTDVLPGRATSGPGRTTNGGMAG